MKVPGHRACSRGPGWPHLTPRRFNGYVLGLGSLGMRTTNGNYFRRKTRNFKNNFLVYVEIQEKGNNNTGKGQNNIKEGRKLYISSSE